MDLLRDIYFLFSLGSSHPVGSPYPVLTSNNDSAAKAQTSYSFAAVALRGTRTRSLARAKKALVEEAKRECLRAAEDSHPSGFLSPFSLGCVVGVEEERHGERRRQPRRGEERASYHWEHKRQFGIGENASERDCGLNFRTTFPLLLPAAAR